MFMHWENTHVLAIVEAMLIFWELTCVLSVVHWITRGNERNFRQCGPLSGSLYYNLTTTQQKDMRDLSNTWRHAGKERDTLQTWQPWWSTVWPLPIKRHVWSINHLETCWQGAWHSPNMAAMVVHCVTFTHQEDMHALSTTWRHGGKERDTPNMAAMVVHCLTSTHQEDMHAISTTWRHAGQHCRLSHVNRKLFLILDLVKMEWNFLQYNEENLIFIFFT